MASIETKFFTFSQNNSGGSFDHNSDAGIGYIVCVEAADADHANSRAKSIGLYFDGCADGIDCPCCGDRWYPAWGGGDPVPMKYGEPLKGEWGIPAYIHYLDGRIEAVSA